MLLFLPELILCGTILLMLLLRVFRFGQKIDMFWVALAGAVAALVFASPWSAYNADELARLAETNVDRQEIFTGLLVYDSFTVFFRTLLCFFAVLFAVMCKISGIPDRDDSPDFYTLVFGSIVGMCLMASANHLLMVFMAVEMASVPSYVLAGFLKGRRQSSEAALKYAVYGAGTAGVMLYGISLLAGVTGSAHLPTIAVNLSSLLGNGIDGSTQMVLVLGGLMLAVGLAFKLSAVPFHFWCPDVFEGASAEVNALLSVASKSAALALLVRMAIGFSTIPADTQIAMVPTAAPVQMAAAADSETPVSETPVIEASFAKNTATESVQMMQGESASDSLGSVRSFISILIAVLAAVTVTFGNLAAYGQTNIKRMLAYSTIAHAGFMMMPVAAGIHLIGVNDELAREAFEALLLYAGIYLFMNLGAFAFIAFIRNTIRSEEISDFAGLIRSAPLTTFCFVAILFGLIGIPPLAGFIGKMVVFKVLVMADMKLLLALGGANAVIALVYYLRLIKTLTIDPEPAERLPVNIPMIASGYVGLITLPVLLLIVEWNSFSQMCIDACQCLVP